MKFQDHNRLREDHGEDVHLTCDLGYAGGVYFLIFIDEVVYVGQSRCIALRIATHSRGPICFDRVAWICVEPERRLSFEREMIAKYKPIYNDPREREALVFELAQIPF